MVFCNASVPLLDNSAEAFLSRFCFQSRIARLVALAARRIVSAGSTGTYTDEGAEFEATALVGKRSLRYHATMRPMVAD
jgi:hypothetical protein